MTSFFRLIRQSVTLFFLAVLCFCAGSAIARVSPTAPPQIVPVSAGNEGNWGLSFQQEGKPPVANASADYLKGACQNAEILVAAAGKAKMLNGDYVGQDAVVLDVGINVDEDGKLCGDVDFGSLEGKAAAATPVPGGVGAVTTAVLAKHLVQAAQRR